MATVEDYLSDLPPANLCVWTDGSVPTNLGPGGAGVLFYMTSARTLYSFPSPIVQFHPASPQRSQSSIMPLDGASNITPLAYSFPWLSLQTPSPLSPSWTLPLTALSLILCRQSGPLSLLIWFGPTSIHWIPGHCDMYLDEIAGLLAKTGDGTSSSSMPLGLLVNTYP